MRKINNPEKWLFYSLYPGNPLFLDNVVLDIITPLMNQLKEDDYTSWFFIRYWDQEGPHIRFRILPKDDSTSNKIRNYIETNSKIKISTYSNETVYYRKPLIPIPTMTNTSTLVRQQTYIPEYGKYGGVKGIDIAEKLFHYSSEMVLQAIQKEREEELFSRSYLSIFLMEKLAKSVLKKQKKINRFLSDYFHYWTGGDSQEGGNFRKKISVAVDKRINSIDNKWTKMENEFEKINFVNLHVKQFIDAIKCAKQSNEVMTTEEDLFFHYMHMMNNRLGISTSEEAYISHIIYRKMNLNNLNNFK